MIYIDIDNVVRDICKPIFGEYPEKWDAKTKEGLSIVDYIKKNPAEIYLNAPPTEYDKTIMDFYAHHSEYVFFISTLVLFNGNQNILTNNWFVKNYNLIPEIIWIINPQDKLKFLLEGNLIDDYPYEEAEWDDRIYIIDRPYNRHIKAKNRIENDNQLKKVLNKLLLKDNPEFLEINKRDEEAYWDLEDYKREAKKKIGEEIENER